MTRSRWPLLLFPLGVVLLFTATWAFPEGLIHVARATREAHPEPMSAIGWFTAVYGTLSMVAGGVCLIVGFVLWQRDARRLTPEDERLDEQWEGEALMDFDPVAYNPDHRRARHGESHRD